MFDLLVVVGGHFGGLLNCSRFGSLQCFDCLEYLDCYKCLNCFLEWAFEPL